MACEDLTDNLKENANSTVATLFFVHASESQYKQYPITDNSLLIPII